MEPGRFRITRIQKEITSLKEAFIDVDVTHQQLESSDKIVICNKDLRCDLTLSNQWPFKEPSIYVEYKSYSWNQNIKDWGAMSDLRAIYLTILNNKMIVIDEEIMTLKDSLPSVEVLFDRVLNVIELEYDGLNIQVSIASKIDVIVSEGERNWPEIMIPQNPSLDLTLLMNTIISHRNQARLKNSDNYIERLTQLLKARFDNVVYNSRHQTFIIDHTECLIIVGIDPKAQYLTPLITVYRQGSLVQCQFEFNSDDLGKVIVEAI